MSRVIHHTFGPLADSAQVKLSLKLFLHSRRWRASVSQENLRTELNRRCKGETFLFSCGREALAAFLKALPHKNDDEVIVQGYTCVVVPNAVTAAGFVPVYADIEKETLNLDPKDVERRITDRTRAVICQHTFGIPAPVEALREICNRRGILLIEDCAHVLPDAKGPEDVTNTGDAILMSFGRDKAVSGITGGVVVVRSQDSRLLDALRSIEGQAMDLPRSTVRRLLLYPMLYAVSRPLYDLGIGRALLILARSFHLLIPIVTKEEKHGRQETSFHKLPEPCAELVLEQMKKISQINDHRRMLVKRYLEASAEHGWKVLHGIRSDLPLQKFPMFVKNASGIRAQLKRENIHLNDGWTGCIVCPRGVDIDELQYTSGSDPHAEEVCEEILSLPTHPGTTMEDADRLIAALEPLLHTNV